MIAVLKRGGVSVKSKELYKAFYIGLTTDRDNLYNKAEYEAEMKRLGLHL